MKRVMHFTHLMRSSFSFMGQFVQSPRQVGAVWPSSRWLCDDMMAGIALQQMSRVAELGAGTGVLTRGLLGALPDNARLDAYEIQPAFAAALQAIPDPRLRVSLQPAQLLSGRYDAIFSGLPLLAFPPGLRRAVLERVQSSLLPGGHFIQFQYTAQLEPELSERFAWQRRRVWLNVPPAWVYQCRVDPLPKA